MKGLHQRVGVWILTRMAHKLASTIHTIDNTRQRIKRKIQDNINFLNVLKK